MKTLHAVDGGTRTVQPGLASKNLACCNAPVWQLR